MFWEIKNPQKLGFMRVLGLPRTSWNEQLVEVGGVEPASYLRMCMIHNKIIYQVAIECRLGHVLIASRVE